MMIYCDNHSALYAALYIVIFLSISVASLETTGSACKDVQNSVVIIPKEVVESHPWLSRFKWPTAKQIRNT